MEKIHVNLGENSYDILFTDGFNALPAALAEINAPKKLLIVTDTNVEKLYAAEVNSLLKENGYDSAVYAFSAGEESKNMNTILDICSACIDFGLDRRSMILALGGGVVGDAAGFAASIYMRGIDFIQIPTTLLSQSDSSVGGKTGVDFRDSKNILGAFHQPRLVYINVGTLKTLPQEQFVSGMGEVIKHGIIRDKGFFDYVAQNSEKIKSLDSDTLIKTDKINCRIKADVVEQDEKENGLRASLNFGHTIGHAVESAFTFTMTHGECVGLGMTAASHIALGRGLIAENELDKIKSVLTDYGFRTRVPLPDKKIILDFMNNDKKKTAGRLKFVLPDGIGKTVHTTDVTENEIMSALDFISE